MRATVEENLISPTIPTKSNTVIQAADP